jgi:hypothetical protein
VSKRKPGTVAGLSLLLVPFPRIVFARNSVAMKMVKRGKSGAKKAVISKPLVLLVGHSGYRAME